VTSVATDDIGETATFVVDSPAECPLIVSTNYVTTLHAAIGDRELPVFPIDIALTGIEVPAGASTIVLAPRADVPMWTRLASLIGWALLLLAIVGRARASEAVA
jgi:hypothetical protein